MRTDEILEVIEVRPLAVPDGAPVPASAEAAAERETVGRAPARWTPLPCAGRLRA